MTRHRLARAGDWSLRLVVCAAALADEWLAVDAASRGAVGPALLGHSAASLCVWLVLHCRVHAHLTTCCARSGGRTPDGRAEVACELREVTLAPWRDTSAEAAHLAERLLAGDAQASSGRVQALIARSALPDAAAVLQLRAALRDQNEEVRLLAHALLERRELQLRRVIEGLERALAESPPAARFARLQRLAYAHFALVEGSWVPVDSESAHAALERTESCARDALALRSDGPLHLLLARVRLRRGDGLGAWRFLQAAERAGVAREQRAPLYAEAAFVLRRFEQVPQWLRRAGMRRSPRPELAGAVAFWLRERRNSVRRKPSS